MRVGVVSDSHGEIKNLKRAVEKLIEKHSVEVIVHLGDNYDDAVVLKNLGIKVIRVPGVFSNHYQNKNIFNRVVETFNGKRVLITHTEKSHENDLPDDLKPEELIGKKAVDVVFYGHTHIPKVEERQGILYVNPGHLKTMDKKGYPPSFAVVDFQNKVNVTIYTLEGEIVQNKVFLTTLERFDFPFTAHT
ncbi:MAG TPA: metallophosphoesterase [Thermoplasmata archaeon]|nr:metallophosphoesterase [Thermoplasmata archaeon]